MNSLWLVTGFFVISLIGGMIVGAVALFLGGAGSLRVLAKRLNVLEERQDDLEDNLIREVKKRASAKGVEARKSTKEAHEEAQAVLRAAGGSISLLDDPRGLKRPSIVGR
jgi:hypothetical protein